MEMQEWHEQNDSNKRTQFYTINQCKY